MAQLSQCEIKNGALKRLDLLNDVVVFKQRFYRSPKARYEKAVPGSFRLLPDPDLTSELQQDYAKTKEMIFGAAPSFDSILETLRKLEEEINALEKM